MVLEKMLSRVRTAPAFTVKLNPKEYKSSVGCSFRTSTNKTKRQLKKHKEKQRQQNQVNKVCNVKKMRS